MVYDPVQLLAVIDGDKWWILGGFGIAMVFQWWWLLECIRVARRDRVYSMPLFCTFFWFAHDTSCVARFHDWFVTYDHWYLKCFWFGLLTAAVLELVFFAQVIKYGREELLPGVSARAFVAGLVVIQVFASVGWEWIKSALEDPLYQLSTPLTIVAYPVFGFALAVRRRSTVGQNLTMWLTFVCMAALWFATTAIWFGDPWRTWQHLAIGVLSVGGGLGMAYLVRQGSRRPSGLAQADAVQDESGHVAQQLFFTRRLAAGREQV